ncbi:hypothetical protein HG530_010999 [Fusarium avenaceum]|nr:hypothetical protein HG530_010999 [Fusarium avenaceum]
MLSGIRTSSEVCKTIKFLVTADAGVGRVHGDDEAVGAQGFTGVTAEDIALDKNLLIGALVNVGGELVVIDPDASAVSNGNAVVVQNFGDLQILQNDIVAMVDINALTSDVRRQSNTDERGVGANFKAGRKSHLALQPHNLGLGALDSSNELLLCRHNDGLSALATSGDSNGVILCITFNVPRCNLEVVRRESHREGRENAEKSRRELHLDGGTKTR